MKPTLLLDMDGPLADFDRHCWDTARKMGLTADIRDLSQQRHRYFTDHVALAYERKMLRNFIDNTRWFRDLPVTEGAPTGVAALEQHFDVWVCTKPLEANEWCRDDKGAWLRKHFPQLERKLIITPDKSMIRGDILLDDAPKYQWMAEAIWRPVIFTAPFNGIDSEWGGFPHWSWGDPIEELLD